MTDMLTNPIFWEKQGLAGLVIFGLFYFIYWTAVQSCRERKEWIAAYKEIAHIHDLRQGETNLVIKELSIVIREKMASEWSGLERRHPNHDRD